ncbi:MAG: WD40 repeat domain-containing protein [Thermoguttaceae bacterium]|nr:WD40 repeat domain-containing protein [Thermoguttaceae bacterium]
MIATGAVPGEDGGHYVADWTEKTSKPTQCYKRERPCDEGTRLAFSRDGKLEAIASACKDYKIYVYDAATFALLKTVPLFQPPYKKTPSGVTVKSCWISAESVFAPEKTRETSVTIPDASGYLRLCDVATGQVKEYCGLRNGAMINFFSFLSSNDASGGARLRWIVGGVDRLSVGGPESNATTTYFFKDDMSWEHAWLGKRRRVLSVAARGPKEGRGKIVIRPETLDGLREESFQKIPGTVACLRYSERDDLIAMGLTGGGVLLWNVKTRSLFGKIPSGDDLIRSMEFSPVELSLTVLYANNRIIDYKYRNRR